MEMNLEMLKEWLTTFEIVVILLIVLILIIILLMVALIATMVDAKKAEKRVNFPDELKHSLAEVGEFWGWRPKFTLRRIIELGTLAILLKQSKAGGIMLNNREEIEIRKKDLNLEIMRNQRKTIKKYMN